MVRFERSRERKGNNDFKNSSPKRDNRSRNNFDDNPRVKERRYSDREPSRNSRYSDREPSRNRREINMTKVICSSCNAECEVPFKPTSTKPVYCNDCFSKIGKDSSDKFSDRDIDIINEKLNKIMKALDIK